MCIYHQSYKSYKNLDHYKTLDLEKCCWLTRTNIQIKLTHLFISICPFRVKVFDLILILFLIGIKKFIRHYAKFGQFTDNATKLVINFRFY